MLGDFLRKQSTIDTKWCIQKGNEVRVADDEDDEQKAEWASRLKRAKERTLILFGFCYRGRKDGTVSEEAEKASLLASLTVMQNAGIIEPQMGGQYVGDATLCSVMIQADHAAVKALLQVQPELRESLEAVLPSIDAGRGR